MTHDLRDAPPLSGGAANDRFFLPDLCRVQLVLGLILVTELVAVLLTLIHAQQLFIDWEYLGLLSLFGNWVVLTCAALLCISRRRLAQLPLMWASLLCFILIQLVTLLYSLAADRLVFINSLPTEVQWSTITRNLLISSIIGGTVLRYFFLEHQWRRQRQAELEARLQALQARIHPHFLFNSMNTIASLIAIDPQAAEDAVLDLSELFRATLADQGKRIALREELTLCRRYLSIERLRLGERMQVEWDIDTLNQDARLPPLILQPLVENAVYHGIAPLQHGGTIHIHGHSDARQHRIRIVNPLPSAQTGPAKHPASGAGHRGNHIALQNIRDRLHSLYGDAASLHTTQSAGIYTVDLSIPAHPLSTPAAMPSAGTHD